MSRSKEVSGRRSSHAHRSLSALALLAAACGGNSAPMPAPSDREATTADSEPVSNTEAPSEAVASRELAIIVPRGADGSLPADLWVGCKYGPQFQVSDLQEIVLLSEGDPGGVAAAIESFLGSGEGASWPQDDWQILRHTEAEILLVHRGSSGMSFMNVRRVGGAWEWSGSQSGGACPLHYVVPEELNTVDWRLDPDVAPDAGQTTLAVLVRERECVSGRELGDRLRGPQVVMTEDAVQIAFAAQPPPGNDVSCPGNPEAQATVELPAPLGEREIIEGLAIGIDLEEYLD